MTAPAIIDIIAAGVLVLFTLFGARRGLFRTLAGLAIVVLSLAGAGLAAGTLAPPAAHLLAPLVERRIEAKVDEALSDRAQMPELSGPEELLSLLGLDGGQVDSLARRAEENLREAGGSLVEAVVESAAQSVIHGVLYILSFLALSLLLKAAARAVDLMMRLPVLHSANALLGGGLGLIEGVLLLFLVAVLLRQLGLPLGRPPWSESYFLRLFTAFR